jgi:hypothetical protein
MNKFIIFLLQKLEKEATRLISEQPASEGLISEKQAEILENWEALTERADNRKANLEQSRELQRFLADLRDLVCTAFNYILEQSHVYRTSNLSNQFALYGGGLLSVVSAVPISVPLKALRL